MVSILQNYILFTSKDQENGAQIGPFLILSHKVKSSKAVSYKKHFISNLNPLRKKSPKNEKYSRSCLSLKIGYILCIFGLENF